MDAENIALTAAENLDQLDGHSPWRPCQSSAIETAKAHRIATAYIEVVDHITGDTALIYLAALPEPAPAGPTFDDGAAADRAHDNTVRDELGAL